MFSFGITSSQQCIWGIITATPVTRGVYIAGMRGPGGEIHRIFYPHFGVLAGEVRSAAASAWNDKKND
jgi:hypothetical protein